MLAGNVLSHYVNRCYEVRPICNGQGEGGFNLLYFLIHSGHKSMADPIEGPHMSLLGQYLSGVYKGSMLVEK